MPISSDSSSQPHGQPGLLRCPGCARSRNPAPGGGEDVCDRCGHSIASFGGVLDVLGQANGQERGDDAGEVERFYERNPFPGYAEGDTVESLLDRCHASPFLHALDRSLPVDARVLDGGCGTGQLACFLALGSESREVWAADSSRGPLRELDRFRERVGIPNLHLLRADLFALPFAADPSGGGEFDLVVSRGVIHHTPEPYAALHQLAARVAPGGHLVLGWYESYGRA
ncbi:MAG: class I SAM-dependent methyltransferase, partial [Holophagales bacterium]|nr:class I SAM-dependent methyltransferase [Holophagales bacterium]